MGYNFLARRAELTGHQASDISFKEGERLSGVIRCIKTDQFDRRRPTFGSERSAKMFSRWLKRKPADIDWVFCAVSHDRCLVKSICGCIVNNNKKSIVRVKGNMPRDMKISDHSLRVGAGPNMAAIMTEKGWRSLNVLSGYLNQAEHTFKLKV